MTINKQAVQNFLNRELDSFTWMKELTHDDLEDEFKKYKVKPEFRTAPWLHQKVCFHIAKYYPQFLFFIDMGGGKTKLVLDTFTQALREGKADKALVGVNTQLVGDGWVKAASIHSNLECSVLEGSVEDRWEAIRNPKSDITVIDYPNLHRVLGKAIKKDGKISYIRDEKKVKELQKVYNFYAGDESFDTKNTQNLRFAILSMLTKYMRYIFACTGTPIGRNPTDAFGQFLLVDKGETFGTTLGLFRSAFFNEKPNYWKGTEYVFDKNKAALFNRFMQHRSIRYEDYEFDPDLPSVHTIPVELYFTQEARQHYLNAVEGLVQARGNYKEVDNAYHRLRQITSGYLSWGDDLGKHVVHFDRNPKLEMMLEIIKQSSDSKFIINTEYTESGRMVTEALKELGIKSVWVYGGSKDDSKLKNKFMTDPSVKGFVMQSRSAGTGTEGLQEVARYLHFFESPSSPVTRKQVSKRVHREGQKRRVFIYDYIIKGSYDLRTLEFIKEGKDIHEALVNGKNLRGLLLSE